MQVFRRQLRVGCRSFRQLWVVQERREELEGKERVGGRGTADVWVGDGEQANGRLRQGGVGGGQGANVGVVVVE